MRHLCILFPQHKPSRRSEINKLTFMHCTNFNFYVLLELNKIISVLDKQDKNQQKKKRVLTTANLYPITECSTLGTKLSFPCGCSHE